MAAFTISYRLPSGGLKSEVIDAADRASALAQMKARGITPVSVKEGGTIAAAAKVAAKQPAWIKGAIAGVIVVVAAIVVWVLYPAEKVDVKAKKTNVATRQKPSRAARTTRLTVREAPPPTVSNAVDLVVSAPVVPSNRVIVARSARSGRVMTLADGTVVTNMPRIHFKRDFDRAIHVALLPNGMGGGLLRQIRLKYTDAQILAMLKEKVDIDPSDDAMVVAVKNTVQNFKVDALRVIDSGSPVSDVLDGMVRRKTEDGLLRAQAAKVRIEALRSDNPDLAKESIRAANSILEQNGIRPIGYQKRDSGLIESQGPEDSGFSNGK